MSVQHGTQNLFNRNHDQNGKSEIAGAQKPQAAAMLGLMARPAKAIRSLSTTAPTNKNYLTQRLLFLTDYGCGDIPDDFGQLGLESERIEAISHDPGVIALIERVRTRLGGRFWKPATSRLLIDLNREPDHPGIVPDSWDGVPIPGNLHLTAAEVQQRLDAYYHPYHDSIAAEIDTIGSRTKGAIIVSVRSFAPQQGSQMRPWHIGVMYNKDDRLARPALDWLRRQPGLTVGDNEPLTGKVSNYTINRHAEARNLAYLSLQVRSTLLRTDKAIDDWAGLIAEMIREVA